MYLIIHGSSTFCVCLDRATSYIQSNKQLLKCSTLCRYTAHTTYLLLHTYSLSPSPVSTKIYLESFDGSRIFCVKSQVTGYLFNA
jgi:hypothetical protein